MIKRKSLMAKGSFLLFIHFYKNKTFQYFYSSKGAEKNVFFKMIGENLTLTVEVESFDSVSAFSTSLRVLSRGVFFLLPFDISLPFLTFLFGQDMFPTSHRGHRICGDNTLSSESELYVFNFRPNIVSHVLRH